MATQVVMPKLSPTMEEGQISRWLKKEGDQVSMGEPLAEIDTDKATMEMQALGTGVLRKILIREGESAPLGQPIAIIGSADEDISALLKEISSGAQRQPSQAAAQVGKSDQSATAPAEQKPSDDTTKTAQASGNGAGRAVEASEGQTSDRLIVSPLAARMAAEAGINLRSLTGSGPGGRLIKRDIEAAMSAGGQPE